MMSDNLKTLSISPSESLSSIEIKVGKLFSGNQYKLRLPATLNTRGALGVEVAVIQLLGTWLRIPGYKKVFHSHQQTTSEDYRELCLSIYGIAALSLSDQVWDNQKNIQPRSKVLNEAKQTIENLRLKDFGSCFKSRYFGIPCIKKPTYDKEFDMPLYNKGDVVESDAFYKLIEKILADTVNGKARFARLNMNIGIQDLSDLLWELFKNTHDHGRIDSTGNEIPLNFRSLIIQQQDITDNYLNLWCGDDPSEAQLKFRSNCFASKGNHHILDISIVDFGSGFVELAKKKAGHIDDIEVFLKCLEQGWTRFRKKNRGDGLTKVLESVNRHKGWLRIRTGMLLLEKTFYSEDDVNITKQDIQQLDNFVEGTSVHISIPLNRTVPQGEN